MKIEKFLASSPLFSLYVAYDEIVRDFQEKLAHEEVHFIQALIVTGLFFEGRPTQPSELARTLRSSRSNISHALRDLERRKWVERQVDFGDARAYYFELTRLGKKRASRLIRIFDSTQEQLEAAGGDTINRDLQKFIQVYKDRT